MTLSAKNATSLTELVSATASYLVALRAEQLASAAHTLRAGRAPFEHRVAVVGASGGELAEKLAVAVGHASKVTAKNAQTYGDPAGRIGESCAYPQESTR